MFDLDELECKFDVVYIDPPLEEYQRRASGTIFSWKPWTWDEVSSSKFSFNVHYVLFKGKYVNVVCKMKVERKMKVVCPTTMLWLNIIKKLLITLQILKLEVEKVAAQRSFLFLWCGSHEGLNEGRKV